MRVVSAETFGRRLRKGPICKGQMKEEGRQKQAGAGIRGRGGTRVEKG